MKRFGIVPTLLLAIFCGLTVSSMYGESATGDEVAHLPAGYTYVKTGDFRLNPEHPPLIKALAGAPLLLLSLKPVAGSPGWQKANEWAFGKDFLLHNRRPRWLLLFLGRLPMVGVGVLMGVLLFLWGRDLWGYWPGVFVLLLYVMCPNILAHAHLVTTDVGVSCFTVMTLYALWRFARGGRLRHVVLCGVGLGLALLSKYSGVVTAMLVAVLLVLVWGLGPPRAARGVAAEPLTGWVVPFGRRRLPAPFAAGLVIGSIAVVLVSIGFGCPAGLLNYYHGFGTIYADFNPYWEAFLWGRYSKSGFRYYYLLAQLWKTPIPTLICFTGALFLVDVSDRDALRDWAFVLVPVAAFHVAGTFNHANIGIRHIMPVFPFLFLASGATARWVGTQGAGLKAALALLCVWLVIGTLRVYPHFLPYFNELAGGPEHGNWYLDDSNVEWGQDHYGLKRYLNATQPAQVRIEAFAPLPIESYGIRFEHMRLRDVVWPQEGITYVVGASFLQRNSLFNQYPGVRFHWLQRYGPVHKIGWSLYVYRFSTDPAAAHRRDVFFVPKDKWYADAIDSLTPLVSSRRDFTEARQLLAEAYADRGRWHAGRGEFEAALFDDLSAINRAPEASSYRAQFREAVADLPAALSVDDAVPASTYFSEAAAAFRAHDQGPAIVTLLRCLKKDPQHLEARLNLGALFAQLGFPGLAAVEWERCLDVDSHYAPARENLARLRAREAGGGDTTGAGRP